MIEAIARARGQVIPFGASILGWYADQHGFADDPQAMRPRIIEAYMDLRGTRLTHRTVGAHGGAGGFPLDPADLREGRGNARLEMFLFEKPLRAPATESGVLPAPPGDVAPRGSPVRAEWLLRARRRFEHCVGPPPPWKCHVSILARSNSGRVYLADRPFRLHSGDGRMLEGRTDRDGWLHADCVLPRDYLLEVDGVSTSVPAMPLHFGPRETRVPSYFICTIA